MKLQPPRGTKDLIGIPAEQHRWIDEVAWQTAQNFGYREISTPIIESTEVFKRSLGETTDIINKEMYTFDDRGGDSITMRPEGTAGVARAFITQGMYREVPLRFYYNGPMFRYERPQKGRQRQFHQLGAEVLGITEPGADVEVIAFASLFLERLGLTEATELEINTLGDQESRKKYREALVEHFSKSKDELSEDSQNRLNTNPLRILDSKADQDQKHIETAPVFDDYLNETSKEYFASVCNGLEKAGVAYTRNAKLVRGLDYYCHTVFEFTTNQLGAQNAVLSGGRYDGLVEQLGGKPTAGIGWAAGIERLALLTEEKFRSRIQKPVAVIGLGDDARVECLAITHQLHRSGISAEMFYSGNNLGKLMKKADKIGARGVVIVGEEELKNSELNYKDLATGDQSKMTLESLIQQLNS